MPTTTDYFPDYLDSSMLSTFKACPEKFFKTYVCDWKPRETSVHLHAGGAFAKGIEISRRSFYEMNFDRDTSIAKGLEALMLAYGDFQCPADSAKSLERMSAAFEFYWDNYALNHEDAYPVLMPGGKRAIEFSFAHPLPVNNPATGQPLLYCGKMDAVLNYGGNVLICDEKTTTALGPTWSRKWDLRGQFIGYCWAAREAGIRVDGALVRGIAILKTKFDTQQAIIMHADWQLNRWYEELLDQIALMKIYWQRRRWPHSYDDSCADYGGCAFREICTSQNEEPWLETYFEKRRWNPVEHKEEKLS